MVFQNKVNAKNAFDLDTDFIKHLHKTLIDDRNKSNETSWMRASCSLDASAKIYGFRVDQVHQETYKVLGGLHRQEQFSKNLGHGTNGDMNGQSGAGVNGTGSE